MFRILSRSAGKGNLYPTRMQEIPMRSLASSIDEPILFQVGNELPNLTRRTDTIMTR